MKKLTTSDWIQAGFRSLTLGGPQAINIEKIAKGLNVSKGSFYWHFKNLAMYKAAMIDFWKARGTADVIIQVNDKTAAPRQQLQDLVARTADAYQPDVGGRDAEAAIRDWARYDVMVAAELLEIDQMRLDFLRALFGQLGQDKTEAHLSARLLYAGLIGLNTLNPALSSTPQDDLLHLLNRLIP